MPTRNTRAGNARGRLVALVAAVTAVVLTGASRWPPQAGSGGGWEAVTGWSGTIQVEVTWDNSSEIGGTRGMQSIRGPVTLDVREVFDGPRRVVWEGENQTLSGTTRVEETYVGADGPVGSGTVDGSGSARGVDLDLFMDLEDGIYRITLDSGGEGIPVRTTITLGDYSESGSDTDFLNGMNAASTGDVPLPPAPDPLSGSADHDLVGGVDGHGIHISFTWSLSPFSCEGSPSLGIDPPGWAELVFAEVDGMGRVTQIANAVGVSPDDAGPLIRWTFPQLTAVGLATDPDDASGTTVRVVYTPLPVENEDFDVEEPVRATLDRCGQRAAAEVPARFFFQRDGTANPDEEEVPNWFYYWLQTAAGQGLSRSEVAVGAAEYCVERRPDGSIKRSYGYYFDGERRIWLCALVTGTASSPVTGQYTDGIDTYAVTVLHEMEHWRHYEEWWREYDETGREWSEVDTDGDDVPDHLEADLGMVVGNPDTNDCGMTDEHYLAWLAEGLWTVGGADEEDWAAPGKQFGRDPSAEVDPVPVPEWALCGIAATGRPVAEEGR